jgi:soluble lytic murein transglycosylase
VLRFLLSVIVILALVGPFSNGFAASDDNSPERNAFQFAERKDWGNALAHAKRASDPVLSKLITWEYVLDSDSGATFEEITNFIETNPNWPEQKKLRLRAETSLHTSKVADKDIIAWFGDTTPVSGIGKIALAEALTRSKKGNPETINSLIRDAWKGGDFDEPQEKKILEDYGDILKREDHIARIDRLLWEERSTAAKRVLSHAPEGHQKLFKARIALQDNKKFLFIVKLECLEARLYLRNTID